jgi:hypothetical protein
MIALATILLLLLPYWQAWRMAAKLKAGFGAVFHHENSLAEAPFRPLKIITGIGTRKVAYKNLCTTAPMTWHLIFIRPKKAAGGLVS